MELYIKNSLNDITYKAEVTQHLFDTGQSRQISAGLNSQTLETYLTRQLQFRSCYAFPKLSAH